MTPIAPNLHTFDPQITGKIGLNVDAPPAGVDQVLWYMTTVSGGSHSTATCSTMILPGLGGSSIIIDADATTRFWVAKFHDSTGIGGISNEITTAASAGPPPLPPPPAPLTQVQHLQAAVGGTFTIGDKVEGYPPTPTFSKTINADGSIS
jgi:hypothetical protein